MANKKGRGGFYLWGGLGVLVLTAGVVLAVYFIQKSQFPPNHRLRIIQDFVARFSGKAEERVSKLPSLGALKERFKQAAPPQPPPAGPPQAGAPAEARKHVVGAGENLWRIAKQGQLVDSPWEWRTILAQNRDKVDYAFMPAGKGGWKVLMEPGKELVVRERTPAPVAASTPRKWALQLAALTDEQLDQAVDIVSGLLKDGHYAYMYRMEVGGKNWYRIRTGFFDSSAEAKAVGRDIRSRYGDKKLFPDKFWLLMPKLEEMRGERFEFGAQNVKPYVIDFPARTTHAEALNDFRKLSGGSDFVYISQRRDPVTKAYSYGTRIGFFATDSEAQQIINDNTAKGDALWKGSRIVAVDNFEEAVPGQNIRLRKPGS